MTVARASARPAPRLRLGDLAATVTAGLVVVLLLVFVAWPGATVLATSFAAGEATHDLLRTLANSLAVSAASTAVTVVLALILAWTATRTTVPGTRVLSFVSLLPLISPPFLVGLALVLLLGRDGLLREAFAPGWSVYGFHGILVAQVFTFLPHAYLLLRDVVGGIDSSLEEAAQNLGAGRLTTLSRVTLALARPGLASATLSVFLLCLTDFGNPLLMGGRWDVLTTAIYSRASRTSDLASAATLSTVLLVPCLAAYCLNGRRARTRSFVTGSARVRTPPRPTPGIVRWPLFVLSGGVTLLLAFLYVLIPLGSLVRRSGSDWSFSLEPYAFAAAGEGARPIWNSVSVALVAGALGTVLALLTAWLIERKRPPGTRALALSSRLPAALPGAVIGVGYVLAFGAPPPVFASAVWILAASVVFWKLPVAVRAAREALGQIDPAIGEAAVSLGAGGVRAFFRIVVPLLTGAALSIFVYFFITGLVTVSAVIFLASPGWTLGSVVIVGEVERGHPGVACAFATAVVGIVVGALLLLRALVGSDRLALLSPTGTSAD